MSLDVYLELDHSVKSSGSGIFVRENGSTVEISREEWDAKFPGREPVIAPVDEDTEQCYHANITHNLGKMAAEAGIYSLLWRPDESSITQAAQLIGPLETGLAKLRFDPRHYKKFNPENGWGNYEGLVRFVDQYLAACKQNPNATVRVSR